LLEIQKQQASARAHCRACRHLLNFKKRISRMQCPVCPSSTLVMSDRQGIEIDYCPQCRGVWLDRGELDKLIERSAAPPQAAAPQQAARGHDAYPAGGHYRKKKRESFLSDIFDFG
jgi:Zn-finger nucleic acid-binding protein